MCRNRSPSGQCKFGAPLKINLRPVPRDLIHINEAAPATRIIHSISRQAQEVTMPMALPWQRRRPSLFAHILAWRNDRVSANSAHERLGPAPASDVICDARWPDQAPDLARYSYMMPACYFAAWPPCKWNGTNLQAMTLCCFASSRDYAHCVAARNVACSTSPRSATNQAIQPGASIVPMPRRSTFSAQCKTAAAPHNT